MIYLYAAKVNSLFDLYDDHKDIFQEKMSLLCPERRKKVDDVKQPKDKARALGAGILLQSALQDYLSLSVCKKDCGHREEEGMKKEFVFDDETFLNARPMRHLEIAYAEKGKPYLPEYPGMYFSLSHSGDYVALALSCHPVGVDIQEKRELSDALQLKYFTEEERKSGYAPFAIFSGKESYIKFTGEGMSRSFTDFSVSFKNKTVTVNGRVAAYVRGYDLEDGSYMLSVCDKCKDIVSYCGN
jgi:phosphopantetheinyl transferase